MSIGEHWFPPQRQIGRSVMFPFLVSQVDSYIRLGFFYGLGHGPGQVLLRLVFVFVLLVSGPEHNRLLGVSW